MVVISVRGRGRRHEDAVLLHDNSYLNVMLGFWVPHGYALLLEP
jgi:hypothetical protein